MCLRNLDAIQDVGALSAVEGVIQVLENKGTRWQNIIRLNFIGVRRAESANLPNAVKIRAGKAANAKGQFVRIL